MRNIHSKVIERYPRVGPTCGSGRVGSGRIDPRVVSGRVEKEPQLFISNQENNIT